MLTCARCGAESPDGFRFCPSCGAPLGEAPSPRQTRKVVTALFCDMTGSTALGEQLDPEVLRGLINRCFAELRATIERHGGTVERFVGDGVMAVFGIPRVQEDDALRAVRAAAEIRERMPALAEEVGVALRFRTGVNTGPVLMGEGENLAVGDAVNVAARLEQAAAPGEILLGEDTLRLVRDAVTVQALEPLELKGKSERVPAFRLMAIDPAAPGFARHLDVPLVGRERELRVLAEAWDRTVEESRCHLFTLLGAAGVGKSRLVTELLARVGEQATVLSGRCLHYGEGITFWPVVEALMPVGAAARHVLDRLSTGGAATPEELFLEVRRLLESLAVERPVLVYIDDLQWAEPMLLDLLDHISDLSRDAPILLLCTARPELLEDRPSWGGGKLNATTVLLEPLAAAESEVLLDVLADGLNPGASARVIAASQGNPLFLEEMVALAKERGTVQVPPTIQALLAARLERLEVEERELLERGAVEGEVFHRLAVRALADERIAAEVELRLSGLVRKELIRPHPATLEGDEAFRFRHLLIRDAAYDGLPKVTRAELHERFARWLEYAGQGLVELDEIAGWHLEQAVRYWQELGRPVDPQLARSAAAHLHTAGRQASRRADVPAARNLLERALALASSGEDLRARIAADLADELIVAGELARVDELLDEAEQESAIAGTAALLRLKWLFHARHREASLTIAERLPALLEQFAAADDHRSLAVAHMLAHDRYWLASRASRAARELKLAAEHAEKAGDGGLRSRALAEYLSTQIYGPAHVRDLATELDTIERDGQGPYLQAFVAVGRCQVARVEGRLGEAREWAQHAIDAFASIRNVLEWWAWEFLADVKADEGDLKGALEARQRADTMLERFGDDAYRSTMQANLAVLHLRLGDPDAARAAIALSDELTAQEDVLNYAITHGVRAELALAEGDGAEAERWARSAVHHAFLTDFVITQATAKLVLARVLAALGRRAEAAAEAHAALELYECKGDRAGVTQAGVVLARM
jgi:class 3 adenylate cyclase